MSGAASPATVTALCEVAAHQLVISDEIYRDLIHDPATPVLSPAQAAPERTVITTGASKNLVLGGWRIGVARMPGGPFGRWLRPTTLPWIAAALTQLSHALTDLASGMAPVPYEIVPHSVLPARDDSRRGGARDHSLQPRPPCLPAIRSGQLTQGADNVLWQQPC